MVRHDVRAAAAAPAPPAHGIVRSAAARFLPRLPPASRFPPRIASSLHRREVTPKFGFENELVDLGVLPPRRAENVLHADGAVTSRGEESCIHGDVLDVSPGNFQPAKERVVDTVRLCIRGENALPDPHPLLPPGNLQNTHK